jgi:D-sedoheptulose 7-phosphate isomerase
MDSRRCQTATASQAEPEELPVGLGCRSLYTGEQVRPHIMFPDRIYSDVAEYLTIYALEVSKALGSIDQALLRSAVSCIEDAVIRRASIFVCGNGGSSAIAEHFVCDYVKGIRTNTQFNPRVTSLSGNIPILTAIANDLSYANVFEVQLAALAEAGDLLIVVSSSGSSPNIIAALEWARKNKMHSIALTGFTGGEGRNLADIALHVDSYNYGVIEDVHQSVMHVMAQFIRQSRLVDPATVTKIRF